MKQLLQLTLFYCAALRVEAAMSVTAKRLYFEQSPNVDVKEGCVCVTLFKGVVLALVHSQS